MLRFCRGGRILIIIMKSVHVVEGIRRLILAWPHPTITWEAVRAAVNARHSVIGFHWPDTCVSSAEIG